MEIDIPGRGPHEIEVFGAFAISSFPQTLKKARELLELARLHEGHLATLAAAACVFLTAALEQTIDSTLQLEIETERVLPERDEARIAELEQFAGTSSRNRMRKLPSIKSNGNFDIAEHDPHLRLLHQLITLRNQIVHISDPTRRITFENIDQVLPNEASASATYMLDDAEMKLEIPLSWFPTFDWDRITMAQVEQYYEAVELYHGLLQHMAADELRNPTIRFLKSQD